MNVLYRLWTFFFGCPHAHTTFPMTRERRTYVACLNCGAEIVYDWREMRCAK
jgi:hypothetical protein